MTRALGPQGWGLFAAAAVAAGCAAGPLAPYRVARQAGGTPTGTEFLDLTPARRQERPPGLPETSTLTLSLEEATFRALARSRELAVERWAPVEAGTFEAIEAGVFDPELFASARFRQERISQVARATGERFDVEGTNVDVSVGLRQSFDTGTDVEAVLEHGLDVSDRTPRQQVSRVGLTITQSLLRGLGPAVNLVGLRQARLDYEASQHQLRAFAENLVLATETAYWAFVVALREARIFQESLDLADRQLKEAETRARVGTAPQLSVAVARAERARRRQGWIDARARAEEARLRLSQLVDGDTALRRPLRATSSPESDRLPLGDVDDRVRLGQAQRPDLLEAEAMLRRGALEVVRTENGLLPRLDLFLTVGKTGFDDSTFGTLSQLGSETYDVLAGVELSEVLGRRARSAQDRAARTTRAQGDAAVAHLRQLVALDVRLAANELTRAEAQVEARQETLELQRAVATAERARARVGSSTGLRLATVERDLLQAQLDLARAWVAVRTARVRLFRAEGSLLQRRGVTLLP